MRVPEGMERGKNAERYLAEMEEWNRNETVYNGVLRVHTTSGYSDISADGVKNVVMDGYSSAEEDDLNELGEQHEDSSRPSHGIGSCEWCDWMREWYVLNPEEHPDFVEEDES